MVHYLSFRKGADSEDNNGMIQDRFFLPSLDLAASQIAIVSVQN